MTQHIIDPLKDKQWLPITSKKGRETGNVHYLTVLDPNETLPTHFHGNHIKITPIAGCEQKRLEIWGNPQEQWMDEKHIVHLTDTYYKLVQEKDTLAATRPEFTDIPTDKRTSEMLAQQTAYSQAMRNANDSIHHYEHLCTCIHNRHHIQRDDQGNLHFPIPKNLVAIAVQLFSEDAIQSRTRNQNSDAPYEQFYLVTNEAKLEEIVGHVLHIPHEKTTQSGHVAHIGKEAAAGNDR